MPVGNPYPKATSADVAQKAPAAEGLEQRHPRRTDQLDPPEDFITWAEVFEYIESFLVHQDSIIEVVDRLVAPGVRQTAARYLRHVLRTVRRTECVTIWASQRVMAEAIGRSRRAVQLAQAALTEVGLISVDYIEHEQHITLTLDCLLALDDEEEIRDAEDERARIDGDWMGPNAQLGISSTSERVAKYTARENLEALEAVPSTDIGYSTLRGFGPDPTPEQQQQRRRAFHRDRRIFRRIKPSLGAKVMEATYKAFLEHGGRA